MYSSRHSKNSKELRAGRCLQTDHAGHCSLVIAWYLYWDIAIVAVASSVRTSWAWLAVLYENEHPLINSCWKKWGDVIFTGRGRVWTNFFKRISTWWFNGLNSQFYVFFWPCTFKNPIWSQVSRNLQSWFLLTVAVFFEFAIFETPRNFILEQEIPKRPPQKKGQKKWREFPLIFWFFLY